MGAEVAQRVVVGGREKVVVVSTVAVETGVSVISYEEMEVEVVELRKKGVTVGIGAEVRDTRMVFVGSAVEDAVEDMSSSSQSVVVAEVLVLVVVLPML